jgi:Cysteine rich repeat
MIGTLRRTATLVGLLVAAIFVAAVPTFSQAPTERQREAIKSECRSDYMEHCSSIPPGGEASLQCLEKNVSSLSSACQSAVRAVETPAAPKAESAPAAAGVGGAPAAATAAPAAIVLRRMLPREELFVLRSACSTDVGTLCAGVAPGGGRLMECLAARGASLSAACKNVLAPFEVQ